MPPAPLLAWLFLAFSIWGALFTLNALRPLKSVIGFFPAWLTTELALHHILWQALATLGFVYLGAAEHTPGLVGLVITPLSWLGLLWMGLSAHRDGAVIKRALEEDLGADFRSHIAKAHMDHMQAGIDWWRVLWPAWMRHRDVVRQRNVPYSEAGHARNQLDIYRHKDMPPGAPVLLQIHGGAWIVGRKEQQGQPLMYHMAARGWLCVAINYRLSPRSTWPDQLIDCKLAVKWVKDNIAAYGGDPDCIVVTGGSAGGHLTSMVALTARDKKFQPGFEDDDLSVQGFIPFYGVFDWTNRFGQRSAYDGFAPMLERLIVKRPQKDAPEIYEQASPMSQLHPQLPPAMVIHGKQDTLAPVAEAAKFVEMLRERSREPVVYVELPGAHHAFEVFPSIRTLHTINGVEAFAAWVASRRQATTAAAEPAKAAPKPASAQSDGSRVYSEHGSIRS